MSSRKELANAIRALSMDAVQKQIPATRVPYGHGGHRRSPVA